MFRKADFFVRKKTQHVQLRLSKADLKMVLTNTKSDQRFNPKSLSASKFQCIISMLLLDLKSCRKENIVSRCFKYCSLRNTINSKMDKKTHNKRCPKITRRSSTTEQRDHLSRPLGDPMEVFFVKIGCKFS